MLKRKEPFGSLIFESMLKSLNIISYSDTITRLGYYFIKKKEQVAKNFKFFSDDKPPTIVGSMKKIYLY